MHTIPSSCKCILVYFLYSLCVIRQVSSRICYICESNADEACFNNVNGGDFQYDCAETVKDHSKFIDNNSFEHQLVLIKEYSTDYQSENVYEFECVTITGVAGRNLNEEKIVRGCIPKLKDCNDFEAHFAFSGFLTNPCERCSENLCNSLPRVPRLPKTSRETESYTEATTEKAKSHSKATTVKAKRLSSVHENTENDATKATTVDSRRSSSLAEKVKFDCRLGVWCATILLRLTFFRCYV